MRSDAPLRRSTTIRLSRDMPARETTTVQTADLRHSQRDKDLVRNLANKVMRQPDVRLRIAGAHDDFCSCVRLPRRMPETWSAQNFKDARIRRDAAQYFP